MGIRLLKRDHRIYKYLEIRAGRIIHIMGRCCRSKMAACRESHHTDVGNSQVSTSSHDAHCLLDVTQRHIMMAARHPVLKNAACESTCIEPLPDVSSFIGNRQDRISASRAYDDASSVRISCRIDFQNRFLIFVSVGIFRNIIGKSVWSAFRPDLNGFRPGAPEAGAACRLGYSCKR